MPQLLQRTIVPKANKKLKFNVFVIDTGSGVKCTLSKFANDPSCVMKVADTLQGRDALQRERIPPREKGYLRGEPAQTSGGSTGQGQGAAPGLGQPLISTQAGMESSPAKEDVGVWWVRGWRGASNVQLQPRKPIVFWAASKAE